MDLKCLRCKAALSGSHQLIFDETGVELQLDKLLADFFEICIEEDPSTTQALCEECVDKLIELYDLTEKDEEYQEDEGGSKFVDSKVKLEPEEVSQNSSADQETNGAEVYDSCEDEEEFKGFDEEKSTVYGGGKPMVFESMSLEAEEDDENLQFENVQYLQELESVNTQDYIRNVIKSELEEITFDRNTVCKICSEVLKSHTALLMHISTNHESEAKTYPCIICDAPDFNSINNLAMHIVLKHYDLNNLSIYSICPECDKRFSNFIEYNKHSCYKKIIGDRLRQECTACSKSFLSNRRYRFHLQFHLEKRRPKACFICDILFSDENDFFEHIMYAHGEQNELTCKKCDRGYTTRELFDNHMKLHKAVRSYHCKYCPKSYLYKQMLDGHIRRHHLQKDEFNCDICKKSLANKSLLTRHKQVVHHEQSEANVYVCSTCGLVGVSEVDFQNQTADSSCLHEDITNECLKVIFACEFCELAFKNVEILKTHRAEHVNKLYKCWICDSEYTEFKKLKTHLITHTTSEPIQKLFPVDRHYVCDFQSCDQSYLTWPSLRAHKKRHALEVKFTCEVCSQTFRTRSRMNAHLKAHDHNEEYPCQFCSKVCSSQMALSVHIARKHNTNFKTCPTCKATYSSEEALKAHIDTNHVQLRCEFCGKLTKNKRNLGIHIRMVHNKLKRFFCESCEKGYYNKSDLRVHVQTAHSEPLKYKCELCEFSTSYEASFKAHVLKHESKKPFKCGECSREFTRKLCFKLHVLRHLENKPFPCSAEGCRKSFVTRGLLVAHMRDTHPESRHTNIKSGSECDTLPTEIRVKKDYSRSVKRKKRETEVPEAPKKYIIMTDGSDAAPIEVECIEGESEIIFAEPANGQEIVLEYDDQNSDLIVDLDQAEFSEFTMNE